MTGVGDCCLRLGALHVSQRGGLRSVNVFLCLPPAIPLFMLLLCFWVPAGAPSAVLEIKDKGSSIKGYASLGAGIWGSWWKGLCLMVPYLLPSSCTPTGWAAALRWQSRVD